MRIKFFIITIMFFLILILCFLVKATNLYLNDDIGHCLDHDGCWDYNRNRCEFQDQGFCAKDKSDCEIARGGIWNDNTKYCTLK